MSERITDAVRSITPVPFPGNDRELIIDYLFWGEDDSHWEKIPGAGCEHLERGHGYARTCTWRAASAGASLTWRGRVEADLVGIDRIRVRAQVAASDRLTLRAEVDGAWVTLAGDCSGNDDYGEYDGPVSGRRLTRIDAVFTAGAPGPVVSSIMWVMAIRAGAPTALAVPDPAWPGLLRKQTDASSAGDATPLVEAFFDAAELETFRAQVREPGLSAAWEQVVGNAELFAESSPEESANPVIPYSRKQYGRPDVSEQSTLPAIATLAFVGLLESRDDLRRIAARWALTLSRCERWVQYGIENLRGIPLSHGRFVQACATTVVSQVLDWCGELLTEAGRGEVARAIHDLGVLDIDGIMQPGSYVWHMNQGIVYESGRFHGVIAIRRWYPDEYDRRLDDAKRMLETCLTTSFHDDGAGTEGSAYWNYTMSLAVPLIAAVARSTGASIPGITPANVAASGRWAWRNRRTDTDSLRFLPHADSSYERSVSPLVAAFLAGPLGQTEWGDEALAAPKRDDGANIVADPLYLTYIRRIREQTASGRAATGEEPSRLTVFTKAGQIDVKPDVPREGMRIYFLGGPRTGHCHDDKNSFVLEAFGKTLLLDRGTPVYTHPATEICKLTEAHNAVSPDGITQTVLPEKGGALLLRSEETDDGRVIIESDAAGCWPGLSTRAFRRLTHSRPATLIVEDEVAWTRPMSTWVCWQSPVEWIPHTEGEVSGWLIHVDAVQMLLSVSSGGPIETTQATFSVDGRLRPVHRLVVRTERGTTARVRTTIRARRVGEAWPHGPR